MRCVTPVRTSTPTDIAQNQNFIGRVEAIKVPAGPVDSTIQALVKLRSYRLGKHRHPDFDMPVLKRPQHLTDHTDIVSAHVSTKSLHSTMLSFRQAVQFIINVQHDCRTSDCQPTGRRTVIQEHQETSQTIPVIEHVDNNRFVINMHAFHNAALLRTALGRDLTQPVPITANRAEWLKGKAGEARTMLVDKHARTVAKAAETRAKNQNARVPAEETISQAQSSAKRKRRESSEETESNESETSEQDTVVAGKRKAAKRTHPQAVQDVVRETGAGPSARRTRSSGH